MRCWLLSRPLTGEPVQRQARSGTPSLQWRELLLPTYGCAPFMVLAPLQDRVLGGPG